MNLVGVYRTFAAAVPHVVRRRGYLLAVASVASFTPLPGAAAYSASKAGVESLVGAVRAELAADGVAVGSAHPCWIDTDMVRDAEHALPVFREVRGHLPWPVGSTTSAAACGEALADAVVRRVYVPRSWRSSTCSEPCSAPARRTPSSGAARRSSSRTSTRRSSRSGGRRAGPARGAALRPACVCRSPEFRNAPRRPAT